METRHILEQLNSINDLGVTLDSNLQSTNLSRVFRHFAKAELSPMLGGAKT